MRISVVIPTYDRAEATLTALCSVLAQHVLPAEVVVVDDHSPVPFALPPDLASPVPIAIVRLDDNGGAAAARNAGIAAASGEWIAFLDSDDVWMPDKLSRQIASIGAASADPWICHVTGFRRIDALRGNRPEELIPVAADSPDAFAAGCWFAPGSTALVHRDAFGSVGGFDPSLRRLEDLDWFLRFGLAGGSLEVAPFVGSLINVAERPEPLAVEQARSTMLAKWSGDAARKLDPRVRRRLSAYLDLECASANLYGGNRIRGAGFFFRSLARAPRLRIPIERWWPTKKG